MQEPSDGPERTPGPRIARAGQSDELRELCALFAARNPGYALEERALDGLVVDSAAAIAFVHQSAGECALGEERSLLVEGDVVCARRGARLRADAALRALVFSTPEELDSSIPSFLRPDAGSEFADQVGGCAEDAGAYRRILLTWQSTVGPYVYRALNCHRVRMTDSLAHYHPLEDGFDELYLVHQVAPGGVLHTSVHVDELEHPEQVDAQRADQLVRAHAVAPGDLVYLPRGTMHRASGGVLAHVVTVPGFRPGKEIGLDHHLRALAERTGVSLPYRAATSDAPVVR